MPLFSVHALVDLRLSQYHGIAEEVKLLPLVPCIIHYLNGRLLQGCVLMYIFCLYFTSTHSHTHNHTYTSTHTLWRSPRKQCVSSGLVTHCSVSLNLSDNLETIFLSFFTLPSTPLHTNPQSHPQHATLLIPLMFTPHRMFYSVHFYNIVHTNSTLYCVDIHSLRFCSYTYNHLILAQS